MTILSLRVKIENWAPGLFRLVLYKAADVGVATAGVVAAVEAAAADPLIS